MNFLFSFASYFETITFPLVSEKDTWLIWTVLIGLATLSLVLENRYHWAKRITGPVLALSFGMLVATAGIMPTKSDVYDVVWEYVVPVVIPLLLLKMNIFRVFRETGRLMAVFHFAALGTVIGTYVAFFLLRSSVPHLSEISPAMAGSYIGGGVNFVAMVAAFKPPEDTVNATLVADNVIMAAYFMFLISLPGIAIVRKIFPITAKTREHCFGDGESIENAPEKTRAMNVLDIAKAIFIAMVIATLSVKCSQFFGHESMPFLVQLFLGQKYLLLTTFSVIFTMLFPRVSQSIVGNDEIATFLIYIFFVCIGLPASIVQVVIGAPLMLVFCAIILFFNFLLCAVLGKLFGMELEEIILAGTVSSGGPMNGVAIANAMQWNKLVVPSMMAGIWGYIIGNYIGYAVGLSLGLKLVS